MELLLATSLAGEVSNAQSEAVPEPFFAASPLPERSNEEGPDDDPPNPPPDVKG